VTCPGAATRPLAGCTQRCGLVPGGVPDEITAARAERILDQLRPAGPAAGARGELAAELLADLRHLDTQRREAKTKLAAAVKASGTSLTRRVFGGGPVIAGMVIGDIRQVSRFPSRDHFASWNGTAPAEVSSGNRKIRRLSRRGNRRLNRAIHMAAVTQIRHKHSDGRTYYEKKIAEGKTHKEALRALKRRVSDVIYAALVAGARQAATISKGPGGQPGNHSASRAAGSHPARRLFGQATPGPRTTLRPAAKTAATPSSPAADQPEPVTGCPAASSQLPVLREARPNTGPARKQQSGETP
jgi:transposase